MKTVDLILKAPADLSESEAQILFATKLYELERISLGLAAELAGLSIRAFMEVLGQHQIPVFSYSEEELRREITQ